MLPACRHSRTPSRCRQWLRVERFFPATSIYDDRPAGRACVKPPATPERGARGPCRAGAGPRRLREGRVSARFLRGPGRAAGRTGTACVGSGPSPSHAHAHGLRAAGPPCSHLQADPGPRSSPRRGTVSPSSPPAPREVPLVPTCEGLAGPWTAGGPGPGPGQDRPPERAVVGTEASSPARGHRSAHRTDHCSARGPRLCRRQPGPAAGPGW